MKDYEYEFDSEIMKDLMPEERYKGDLIKSYMQTEQDTEGEEDTFEPANKLQPLQVEFIEQDPKAKKQCWLYDTPGLINEGQVKLFIICLGRCSIRKERICIVFNVEKFQLFHLVFGVITEL